MMPVLLRKLPGPDHAHPAAGFMEHIRSSGRRPTSDKFLETITGAATRQLMPNVSRVIPSSLLILAL